jgi:TRAP-type C4-dicarboxylate transport system permease small subunit
MREKLNRIYDDFPIVVAGAALSGAILLTTVNALGRYLFSRTFPWTDEIVALCFAWAVFFGSAAACKRGMHYGLEIVSNALRPKMRKDLDVLIALLSLVMIGCLAVLAWVLVAKVGVKIMTATRISYRYLDAGMSIGFTLMALYSVGILARRVKALFREEDERKPE